MADRVVRLQFEVRGREAAAEYEVCLSVEGYEPATSELEVDLAADRLQRCIADIANGWASIDDLREAGAQLWAGLTTGGVGRLLDRVCRDLDDTVSLYQLALTLPAELEPLPWETLYDERRWAFLAGQPRLCIIREPLPDSPAAERPERPQGGLRVLVVIPEGSDLAVRHEYRNISVAVERLGNAIELELLEGVVTAERLAKALQRGSAWDVLHFVGHGEVEDDTVRIRLNDRSGKEHWLEAEVFASVFYGSTVRLVVLNCCLGAHPSPTRSLSGLGSFLLRAGVPAVIAMRYEIEDSVAITFADSFYRTLLSGTHLGRIDRAMINARQSVYLNQGPSTVRSFITPVLFLARGAECLPALQEREEISSMVGRALRQDRAEVPSELLQAVRERRCVPIIGPELLRADATRSQQPPPGPVELAEQLLGHCGLTEEEAQLLAKGEAIERSAGFTLQRVCQLYQYLRKHEWFKLIHAIQDSYRGAVMPLAMTHLAGWPVPGFICTHFDDLLAVALQDRGRAVRTINRIDQDEVPIADLPILVNLRGSVHDPGSLVLTEEDHERLWDRMVKLNDEVVTLVTGELGRSLLLLGVSPGDPAVRRFLARLLHDKTRTQGPIFFVLPGHSQIDEAYWQRFDVIWIDEAPGRVIDTVQEHGLEERWL